MLQNSYHVPVFALPVFQYYRFSFVFSCSGIAVFSDSGDLVRFVKQYYCFPPVVFFPHHSIIVFPSLFDCSHIIVRLSSTFGSCARISRPLHIKKLLHIFVHLHILFICKYYMYLKMLLFSLSTAED